MGGAQRLRTNRTWTGDRADAGLVERYVREWLSGMTCAEYLTYHPDTQRFSLPPEGAEVLAREGGPAFLGGIFQESRAVWDVLPDVEKSFEQGGGVSIDRYHRHWWDGMERFTGTWFDNLLLQEWIPKTDGLEVVPFEDPFNVLYQAKT